MKSFSVAALLLLTLSCFSCEGEHSHAANGLQSAFQTGCSIDGTLTEQALTHTSALSKTIAELQSQSKCQGIASTLSSVQSLNHAIARLQDSPTTAQLKSTQENQNNLLLQLSQTQDPNLISLLTQAYAANALDIATIQGMQVTMGGPTMTPLQQGMTDITGYLSEVLSNRGSLADCARENPLLGAQLSAGLLSVSGGFAAPVMGAALAVAGSVLSNVLEFARDKVYADEINNLNLVEMSDSLACGLESMSNVYCDAKDIMTLTHLQECSYNPKASNDCEPYFTSFTSNQSVSATQFWKGLDVLSRSLPAFQLWVQNVVSGVIASDVYDAGRQNDPAAAVSQMDTIRRLADGWENQQLDLIQSFKTDPEKHTATVRAISTLVSILAYANTNTTVCMNGGCTASPLLNFKQSSAAILYALVNQPLDCTSSIFGGTCKDANTILLPGDRIVNGIRSDGDGGWPQIIQAEKLLFNLVYGEVDQQKHQALDADPARILEAAKIPNGVGLPSPFQAMNEISTFLKDSQAYYAQVDAKLLDGGEVARAGILNLLHATQSMIDHVAERVVLINGDLSKDADEETLKDIYSTLNLAKDPGFINQRIQLHIHDDLNLRIKAGDGPKQVDDILRAGSQQAAAQLTGVPSQEIDKMYASLGNAMTTSRLNISGFVSFFSQSLAKTLELLKQAADQDHEPNGGSPRTAPFRTSQARICILIASTQATWPQDIPPSLCAGTYYESQLTGQRMVFDDLYQQMSIPDSSVAKRICTFSDFYKTSARFVKEKPQK